MPERIQLRRTKGWRKPEGAIVVARPSGWGNPFAVGKTKWLHGEDGSVLLVTPKDNAEAVAYFRWYVESGDRRDKIVAELRGHDLACWCPLEDEQGNRVPCHADVLLEIANTAEKADRAHG